MEAIEMTYDDVQRSIFDVPEAINSFQDDVFGVGALCRCVREMLEGKTKTAVFITAKHDGSKWIRTGGFIFSYGTFDGIPCFRWGINDSSVVATWYPDCCEPARVVGTIIGNYGPNIFRSNQEARHV